MYYIIFLACNIIFLSRTIANQSTRLFSQVRDSFNGQKCSDEEVFGCEIGATRAHTGWTQARRVARRRRRVATLGVAASLSQPCAVRARTTREEEAPPPPPLLAVARVEATRRDDERPSVRRRALVRVRTSTETRDPRHVNSHPVQWCAAPFSSGSCHSISSARRDDLVLPRRIIESLSLRSYPAVVLSFHPRLRSRQLSDNLFVHPPSWDASRSFLR